MTVYYATLSHGLRGCYMPDGAYPIKFSTRRELKALVADEANAYRDAGFIGASKARIASMVQEYWERIGGNNGGKPPAKLTPYDTVLPLARERGAGEAFGIFLSPLTRDDYRAAVKETENN